jgi:hypothetical protein
MRVGCLEKVATKRSYKRVDNRVEEHSLLARWKESERVREGCERMVV